MLRTARIIFLLLAALLLAASTWYLYLFILNFSAPDVAHFALTTMALGLLTAATFYIRQGIRDEAAVPDRTVRKIGDTIALAGFSFLAFLYGFFSLSTIWFNTSILIGQYQTEGIRTALETSQGTRDATLAAAATMATILVGLIILYAFRWHASRPAIQTPDKDLRQQYFWIFVLTFIFPAALIPLPFTSVAPAFSDALRLQWRLGDLADSVTNAILWSLLGLKCAHHLHHRAPLTTATTSAPEAPTEATGLRKLV